MGVTVQGEHDGLEEGRSDPEGRGAHGPARPTWPRRAKRGGARRSDVGHAPGPAFAAGPRSTRKVHRSSRRAPRSCGCSRPSPWSSAPRLRCRRPPPRSFCALRFFDSQRALRPPPGPRRGAAREARGLGVAHGLPVVGASHPLRASRPGAWPYEQASPRPRATPLAESSFRLSPRAPLATRPGAPGTLRSVGTRRSCTRWSARDFLRRAAVAAAARHQREAKAPPGATPALRDPRRTSRP